MTREEFATLRPGDYIRSVKGGRPRRVIAVSSFDRVRDAKWLRRKGGGPIIPDNVPNPTLHISLAIRRLSWTRRPYTVYCINDREYFVIVKRLQRHPPTLEYGRMNILPGTPKEIRDVVDDQEAAISDELSILERLKSEGFYGKT